MVFKIVFKGDSSKIIKFLLFNADKNEISSRLASMKQENGYTIIHLTFTGSPKSLKMVYAL